MALYQGCGLGSRGRVVPELGRAERFVAGVEHHQPVLLAGHRHRGHVAKPRPALGQRFDQSLPPGPRILLAAGRVGGRVARPAYCGQLTGLDVAQLDLGGLRG